MRRFILRVFFLWELIFADQGQSAKFLCYTIVTEVKYTVSKSIVTILENQTGEQTYIVKPNRAFSVIFKTYKLRQEEKKTVSNGLLKRMSFGLKDTAFSGLVGLRR